MKRDGAGGQRACPRIPVETADYIVKGDWRAQGSSTQPPPTAETGDCAVGMGDGDPQRPDTHEDGVRTRDGDVKRTDALE